MEVGRIAEARGAHRSPWRLPVLLLALAGILVGLYAVAGYWLAPRLIASQAKQWVGRELGLDLRLGKVRVDPFALKVALDDIALPAADPMVAARHVEIDFAASTLFSETRRFDSIRLVGPSIRAVVEPDGKLNLLRLMPKPNKDPMPSLLIAELDVQDGRALFSDHSTPRHPSVNLIPVSFQLHNLHTTRDDGGRFRLEGKSDRGEQVAWTGRVSMAPTASAGKLEFRGVQMRSAQDFLAAYLPATLKGGRLDADLSYDAGFANGALRATADVARLTLGDLAASGRPEAGAPLVNADVSAGGIALSDIHVDALMPIGDAPAIRAKLGGVALRQLAVKGTGPAAGEDVRLASLDIGGVEIAQDMSVAAVGFVRANGLSMATLRDAAGNPRALKLLNAGAKPATGKTGRGPAAEAQMPRIGELSLGNASFTVTDRSVQPSVTWKLAPFRMTLRDSGKGPMQLDAEGRMGGAHFSLGGNVDPAKNEADVAVKLAGFPLRAVLPYAPRMPALDLQSGTAAADGRATYRRGMAHWRGKASIDNLRIIETAGKTEVVAWKRFAFSGMDADQKQVAISDATLSGAYGNIAILPDSTLNVMHLVSENPPPMLTMAPGDAQGAAAPKPALIPAAATPAAKSSGPAFVSPIALDLRRLAIDGGTMDFADMSIDPRFAARISGLHGDIRNISTRPGARATLDLAGYVVDRFSPVTVKGDLTPLQYDRHTAIDMHFHNIELPVFNPYSGRYAGYAIAKGKLSTDLSYRIDNRALDANHHIVIDQLEWGDATESKEKVPLPLKFATSLMKDSDGVITLDVPVKGTIDDPSFRIGPIVWKIIGNVISRAVTAPFRALGSLFGDKPDVQFIDFAPGSASLPPEAADNIDRLAKGLAQKPGLRLEIPSGEGTPLDAEMLADRQIGAAAMAGEKKGGDLFALPADKQLKRMEKLYKTRIGSKPAYPAPDAAAGKETDDARTARELAWVHAELRKVYQPGPDSVAALGKARADAVRSALVDGHGMDASHIFLSDNDGLEDKDGKSRMELRLKGG